MRKKKGDHCIVRNSNLFCSNCGQSQVVPYPINPEIFSAMASAFVNVHKNCAPTWKEPEVNQALSEQQKAAFWITNGERGVSSETMYGRISGNRIVQRESHPHDPDDFRRCYLLLKAVPEWRLKLDIMKSVSPAWSNLVDNWDKLTEMLEEQIRTNKANGMYELMQECIYGKKVNA